jgi:hypothetical protein
MEIDVRDVRVADGAAADEAAAADTRIAVRVLQDLLPSVTCTIGEGDVAIVRRAGPPLTDGERELLGLLPAALADLRALAGAEVALPGAQLLEDLLVTRLVHRRLGPAVPTRTTTTVLAAIRELSDQQEEGRPATSGVVVVADVAAWCAHAAADPALALEPFAVALRLTHDFFARPAAHHYVDGRRSFYVVGPDLEVVGLVRIADAGLDELAVATGRHVDRLLSGPRAWAACVGAHSTVDVHGGRGVHLRRRTSHWRLLDRELLPGCLRGGGMRGPDAELLAGALTALSDARTGTLVLVPTGGRTPQLAGVIDSSPCGAALLTHLVGRHVSELRDSRALLGILACDGMSVVGADGVLALTGAIIDLDCDAAGSATGSGGRPAHGSGEGSGGGRTHAAVSASRTGVAVKVSADGQVTVYQAGRPLLHLER